MAEEMGEYGEHFSKVERHFLEEANLAKNNEKNVTWERDQCFLRAFCHPQGNVRSHCWHGFQS